MIEIQNIDNSNRIFRVIFSYQPPTSGQHNIFLAGDFNDFSAQKNRMIEKNGYYFCSVELPKGKYSYKFIVDGNWIPDIDADEISADGYGGHNSVLYVGNPVQINTCRIVHLQFIPEKKVEKVCLAGTFNKWDPGCDRLLDNGRGVY